MTRNSGRFGFSRVIWDREIIGSDDEGDSTAQEVSPALEDAAMDVDSGHAPPPKINARASPHHSPTSPLSEIQSETEKAREIIGGIKLCRIWVDPLDKGQVCYQGDSRFRILKMNWRRDAELRRMAATTSEKGVTHSGNDTTQPAQLAGYSPVVSSSHTSHSPKKNVDNSSTLTANATRKVMRTTNTDLFRQWKVTGTLRMKKKREKSQSQIDTEEFPRLYRLFGIVRKHLDVRWRDAGLTLPDKRIISGICGLCTDVAILFVANAVVRSQGEVLLPCCIQYGMLIIVSWI
jgi:hypothetical protein